MTASVVYLRFEILRTLRNRRFFFFALVFPVVIYFLIAAPNKGETNFGGTGIGVPLYYMLGLVSFGTMSAMLSAGSRIAAERTVGWNRQLRITPLTPRAYFRAKVATGYMTALITILVLYICGTSLGVRLGAGEWLQMTGLILVALIPFAAIGIALGHVLTADSIGPAVGGTLSLFAFLGGTWFPLPDHGFLHDVGVALPSYWIVQASHVSTGGNAWSGGGWLCIAIWTAVASVVAMQLYRRDTGRA
jgi:ABC-2 type transport system permease protein